MMELWGQLYCIVHFWQMMSSVFMMPSFANIFMVINFIIIVVLRVVIGLTSLYMLS